MTKRDIQLLAKYNAATNKKMGEHIATLSADEWNRDFDAFYPSIASLCGHLLDSDKTWLWRFSDMAKGEWTGLPVVKNYTGDKNRPAGPAEWQTARTELDEAISAFAASLDDALLLREFSYRRSNGQLMTGAFGDFVLHMFNHQTHHRGMVSVYLEFMGRDNDFSNLAWML